MECLQAGVCLLTTITYVAASTQSWPRSRRRMNISRDWSLSDFNTAMVNKSWLDFTQGPDFNTSASQNKNQSNNFWEDLCKRYTLTFCRDSFWSPSWSSWHEWSSPGSWSSWNSWSSWSSSDSDYDEDSGHGKNYTWLIACGIGMVIVFILILGCKKAVRGRSTVLNGRAVNMHPVVTSLGCNQNHATPAAGHVNEPPIHMIPAQNGYYGYAPPMYPPTYAQAASPFGKPMYEGMALPPPYEVAMSSSTYPPHVPPAAGGTSAPAMAMAMPGNSALPPYPTAAPPNGDFQPPGNTNASFQNDATVEGTLQNGVAPMHTFQNGYTPQETFPNDTALQDSRH